MVGYGQQQGRIGTQAATESGDKELTDDWAPGRGGDSSPLGACPGESCREAGRRRACGAEPVEPTSVGWPWWSVRGRDRGEGVSWWWAWPRVT